MKIAVAKEIDPSEPRVAASPDTVKKYRALGVDVAVEPGAGIKSGLPDTEFTAAGATVSADAVKDADIVIKVKRPEASELAGYKRGALVIAIMDPYGNDAALKTMADAGVSAFAMELMPRITRAQEMSKEYQAKQAALTAEHLKKQDIVITTALIPGRPAPKLVSAEMVKSMKPGSVLVDLAVERGGNVEGAKPDEVVDIDGIKIVGYTNVAGRVAASASGLYARNLFSFIETLVDKANKALAVNWDDELVKATALTKDGAVIHPNFQPKA